VFVPAELDISQTHAILRTEHRTYRRDSTVNCLTFCSANRLLHNVLCYHYCGTSAVWRDNIFTRGAATIYPILLHCVLKNMPTLASCSFDKHGLILIIFGKLHQHTFKNNTFNFPCPFTFTYFICF